MYLPIEKSELFLQFVKNANYSRDEKLLIHRIIDFLKKYVQTKRCLEGKKIQNKLKDMLCKFSLYSFDPSIFVNNKKRIAKGSYGEIYDSGVFEGVNVITKTPMVFDTKTITEMFVNFVIINTMLLQYKILEKYLIPSYGLFICEHTYSNNHQLTSICKNGNGSDGYPNLHLVQKRVNAKTLGYHLSKNNISFNGFKSILKKIFGTLILFEESPYRLYHNDLHTQNILLDMNNPVIIDFGFSSFEIKEKNKVIRYCNYFESDYSSSIYSGAYDFMFLLDTSRKDSKCKEIRDYCTSLLDSIIFKNYWEDQDVFLKETSINTKEYYLYDILYHVEKKISKKSVHQHNMNELQKMTYRWLYNQILYSI
jgi:hypothetical protein